jgi:hypothetical protein
LRGAAARPSASAWAVPLQPLYNGQAPLAWVVGTAMLMIADLWHPPAADPQLAAFGSTIVSSSQVVCSASACLQQHTHTDAHSHKQCKVSGQDRSENCGPLLQQLSLSRLLTFMLRPVLASAPVTHAPASSDALFYHSHDSVQQLASCLQQHHQHASTVTQQPSCGRCWTRHAALATRTDRSRQVRRIPVQT